MKTVKIFYSWQSDFKNSLLKKLFNSALKKVKKDFNDKLDIVLCQDSRSQTGMIDLSSNILDEIDSCNIFVGDLSLVGSYANSENIKYIPNVNVVFELGYATSKLGLHNILCFFDSESGDISQLPFDLRNKRILKISSKNDEEITDSVNKVAVALAKLVTTCDDNDSAANYKIGSYDLINKKILDYVAPIDIDSKLKILRNSLINNIKECVDEIQNIFELENRIKKSIDKSNPVPYCESKNNFLNLRKAVEAVPVVQDNLRQHIAFEDDKKECILAILRELKISIDINIFNIESLTQSIFNYADPTIDGDENEKQRYFKLNDLYNHVYYYKYYKIFVKIINKYLFVPIAIENISNDFDEDIGIVIKFDDYKLTPISDFLTDEIDVIEDEFYEEILMEGLFKFITDENIDDSYEYPNIVRYNSLSLEHKNLLFGSYVYSSNNNFVKTHIDSCKNKEIKYLPKYIPIRKDDSKGLVFNISVKSKKNNISKQIILKSE